MDDKISRKENIPLKKSKSSILKEVEEVATDSPVATKKAKIKKRLSKRVSFADTTSIKEFLATRDAAFEWNNTYEEPVVHDSSSSMEITNSHMEVTNLITSTAETCVRSETEQEIPNNVEPSHPVDVDVNKIEGEDYIPQSNFLHNFLRIAATETSEKGNSETSGTSDTSVRYTKPSESVGKEDENVEGGMEMTCAVSLDPFSIVPSPPAIEESLEKTKSSTSAMNITCNVEEMCTNQDVTMDEDENVELTCVVDVNQKEMCVGTDVTRNVDENVELKCAVDVNRREMCMGTDVTRNVHENVELTCVVDVNQKEMCVGTNVTMNVDVNVELTCAVDTNRKEMCVGTDVTRNVDENVELTCVVDGNLICKSVNVFPPSGSQVDQKKNSKIMNCDSISENMKTDENVINISENVVKKSKSDDSPEMNLNDVSLALPNTNLYLKDLSRSPVNFNDVTPLRNEAEATSVGHKPNRASVGFLDDVLNRITEASMSMDLTSLNPDALSVSAPSPVPSTSNSELRCPSQGDSDAQGMSVSDNETDDVFDDLDADAPESNKIETLLTAPITNRENHDINVSLVCENASPTGNRLNVSQTDRNGRSRKSLLRSESQGSDSLIDFKISFSSKNSNSDLDVDDCNAFNHSAVLPTRAKLLKNTIEKCLKKEENIEDNVKEIERTKEEYVKEIKKGTEKYKETDCVENKETANTIKTFKETENTIKKYGETKDSIEEVSKQTKESVEKCVEETENNIEKDVKRTENDIEKDVKEIENTIEMEVKETENNIEKNVKETENNIEKDVQKTENIEMDVKETESTIEMDVKETENDIEKHVKEPENNIEIYVKESENSIEKDVQKTENNIEMDVKEPENNIEMDVREPENNIEINVKETKNYNKNYNKETENSTKNFGTDTVEDIFTKCDKVNSVSTEEGTDEIDLRKTSAVSQPKKRGSSGKNYEGEPSPKLLKNDDNVTLVHESRQHLSTDEYLPLNSNEKEVDSNSKYTTREEDMDAELIDDIEIDLVEHKECDSDCESVSINDVEDSNTSTANLNSSLDATTEESSPVKKRQKYAQALAQFTQLSIIPLRSVRNKKQSSCTLDSTKLVSESHDKRDTNRTHAHDQENTTNDQSLSLYEKTIEQLETDTAENVSKMLQRTCESEADLHSSKNEVIEENSKDKDSNENGIEETEHENDSAFSDVESSREMCSSTGEEVETFCKRCNILATQTESIYLFDVKESREGWIRLKLKDRPLHLLLDLVCHDNHQMIVRADSAPHHEDLKNPPAKLAMRLYADALANRLENVIGLNLCGVGVDDVLREVLAVYERVSVFMREIFVVQASYVHQFTNEGLKINVSDIKTHLKVCLDVKLKCVKGKEQRTYPVVTVDPTVKIGNLRKKTLENAVSMIEDSDRTVLNIARSISLIVHGMCKRKI